MNRAPASARIFLALVVGLLAIMAYVLHSSPSGLVVNTKGEAVGLINVARARVQGERFWREQLQQARSSLDWQRTAPERQARRDARIAELEERTARVLEETYEKYPNTRPSPAERKAEALRAQADRIEQAELERWLEERRLARVAELERVVQVLEARTQ